MKVAQIAILARVYGNVNADGVIGQRVTLKRMYSSDGETYPFVSARAIKYAIRQALREKGHDVDPFEHVGKRVIDSGDPIKYTDNDIFGFMRAPKGEKEIASRRQAPIAISYFKALKDTPITTEIGLRSPRTEGKNQKEIEKESRTLLPFEVEVAEFVGRINCIVYDYIGKYQGTEKLAEKKAVTSGEEFIPKPERRRRLRDFLEVFLTPSYVLPRRTNSLNIPEYICALIALSEKGAVPIFQYFDYVRKDGKLLVDVEKLDLLADRKEIAVIEKFLIDYHGSIPPDCPIGTKDLDDAITNIVNFLIPEEGAKASE
ncbi:MAG: type I-B CRISPR-associated protein Cas7/Cst2/DevR [Candidatus Hadarchaeum sp.]|uniref:type I-B CRISPR-associated protein Cas7/Cst2/DevR n=1 Tax=Candidatus Hadarchaeum sp. TaxID=2883567 RepID=UPI003171183C